MQIVFSIKQSEQGVKVEEICRKMGISDASFYNWKKKYGGLGVSELREIRQLKDANTRLKQMVADLSLDKQMLQDVIKKNSKASPEEGAGLRYDQQLLGVNTEGVSGSSNPPFGLLLSASSTRRSGHQSED